MKTRLDQFTVSGFLDLICGDSSVLCENGEEIKEEDAAKATRDILLEYKSIADPAGMKVYLMRLEEVLKARLTVQILTICRSIAAIGKHANAREVFAEMRVDTSRMDDGRLETEILSRLGRAKTVIDEYEKECEETSDIDIRRQFDEQSVAMMAHFRFQLDPDTMKAGVYAHMVARYVRELKALEKTAKGS